MAKANKTTPYQKRKLKKEIKQQWNKIYSRFIEDTKELVEKAGGDKKLALRNDAGHSVANLYLDFREQTTPLHRVYQIQQTSAIVLQQ